MAELLTVKEAAKYAKVSYQTIGNHIRGYRYRNGERVDLDRIPTKQVSPSEYRIDKSELDVFLNRYNDSYSYNLLLKGRLRKAA